MWVSSPRYHGSVQFWSLEYVVGWDMCWEYDMNAYLMTRSFCSYLMEFHVN